ncbi:MAG: hypothetical protein V3V15_07335 [Sphingorhabdus sp.]
MPKEIAEATENDEETGVAKAQLATLVSDFRQLAEAEIKYLKMRAAYSGKIAKWTGIYVALALFAVLSAFIGLVIGLLLFAASLIGIVPATIVIAASFLGLAWLAATLARRSAQKLVFGDGESEVDD